MDKCCFLFTDHIDLVAEALVIKDMDREKSLEVAEDIAEIFEEIEEWTVQKLEERIQIYMDERGLNPGQLLSFIREAVSGQRVTPPLYESLVVLGREKALERMKNAAALLKE